MSTHKDTTTKIIQANLLEHPAVKAWSSLEPERVEPERIEILRDIGPGKTAVFRIAGVGLGGAAVIAKRSWTAIAVIERTIYEKVLPYLPIPLLHYYGFVEEDRQFCWLFLEDAGGESYSPDVAEHRRLAAQWMGIMHTSAERVASAVHLPNRGPEHYLDHLRGASETIQRSLTNPSLKPDDLEVLERILSQCDLLAARWSMVEESCDGLPSTLAHGDFKEKNVCVRTSQAGAVLLAFDWETAGWGVPAVDVGRVDVSAYWSVVRDYWPGLNRQTVQRMADVGKLFRCLAAINWAAQSLAYEWIDNAMMDMRIYQARMLDAIQTVKWAE